MADIYVREYSRLGEDRHGIIPAPQEPAEVVTEVVTNPTSATSHNPSKETKYVMITSTAAFHYVVAASPTATTSHFRVPADVIMFVGIAEGMQLSFINAA